MSIFSKNVESPKALVPSEETHREGAVLPALSRAERRRRPRRQSDKLVPGETPRRFRWLNTDRWPFSPIERFASSNAADATAESVEGQDETREAELIVAVFRTVVLLAALFGPRLLHLPGSSLASENEGSREIWLAAVAGLYNILTGLGCLFPSRYGLRRPFVVTMDLLLITLWIQWSQQWELRPFYYIVVVVAAMWFRVFGGLLAASFCNFFFLYIFLRAWMNDASLLKSGMLTTTFINTAMFFLVGALVGYMAEAQERDRERRLEDQLLIANYQREIDLSAQLQPSLISSHLLEGGAHASGTSTETAAHLDKSLEVGAAMKSARLLGGGDYFDLIPLPDGRTGLCIADVSGKSVRAQARLPLLKYSLRALAPLYLQPDRLIERLNETLAPDLQPELYIALCYIVLDPRRQILTWCNAGHIAPLLLPKADAENELSEADHETTPQIENSSPERSHSHRQTLILNPKSAVQPLDTDGPAIGMFPDLTYEARTLPWESGSQLLLYTDGLTDAFSYRGSEDGEGQVRKIAQRLRVDISREPHEVAQELVDLAVAVLDDATPLERAQSVLNRTSLRYDEAAKGDNDAKHRDDITVVIVRHKTDDVSAVAEVKS